MNTDNLRAKLQDFPPTITVTELRELLTSPHWHYIGIEENHFTCELCGKKRKCTHVFIYSIADNGERNEQIDIGTECYKKLNFKR